MWLLGCRLITIRYPRRWSPISVTWGRSRSRCRSSVRAGWSTRGWVLWGRGRAPRGANTKVSRPFDRSAARKIVHELGLVQDGHGAHVPIPDDAFVVGMNAAKIGRAHV